ncbi:centromere protein P-like isoform X2 [Haliotis rufescens]|uniref:centromere protein P-like isoform X2 n=1 Tax=Haliotis rufescens TaxID=6454 RepID=UPI00201F4EF0|nr:centromere protein P-like isoform X2 [Haliotis rufescens]
MAGSLEIDTIASSVQRKIDQMDTSDTEPGMSVLQQQTDITGHTDTGHTDNLDNASSLDQGRELTGLGSQLHTQVLQLEQEISNLEVKIDLEKKRSFGKEEDFRAWLRDADVSALSLEEVQEEIDKLEEMLDMNQKLTGLQFNTTNWITLEQDQDVLSRQHFIEGFCNGTPFQLTYDILEDFSVKSQGTKVTEVTLYVEDDIEATIGTQLQQLTEDREIPGFFTILVSFLRWREEREEVMSYCVEKFPDHVRRIHQDQLHGLVIHDNNHNRPSCVLEWGFMASPLYRIDRHLTLAVKVPQKMADYDKDDTLAETPEVFSTMVKKLGVQKSIEVLIHMVTAPGQDKDT